MQGGGCCSHDHDCGDFDCGGSSLHNFIDHPKIRVLNASNPEAAKNVFRPWEQRTDREGVEPLDSDEDDPELLLFIPFTSDVKIKSIMLIGGDDGSSPDKLRAFTNREDLDFSVVHDLPALQEWDLAENPRGELEYQTRFTKFQGVANLTLHVPSSFNGDNSRVWFIGLRGEGTNNQRRAVTNVVYEAVPQPEDHKVSDKFLPQMGV